MSLGGSYAEYLREERDKLLEERKALLVRLGELALAPLEYRETERRYEEVLVQLAVIRRELEEEGETDETDGTD